MRHRFHAICPYFAMFPESFVQKHLIWSKPGDLVLDPFCGRGTAVFQSLLSGRAAIGSDTNPVAVCVSRAKVDPPRRADLYRRLRTLEDRFQPVAVAPERDSVFFQTCFHHKTLEQLLFLRSELRWKHSRTDCFIAAIALGCLHGESHRSQRYFSNRMPRTISTKPAYSVAWWSRFGYEAPLRDVFSILREQIAFRLVSAPAELRGQVAHVDVRRAGTAFDDHIGSVSLVITSPPYLDTTDFAEDQWLRLWLLRGSMTPTRGSAGDDRHRTDESYWTFLTEAWAGIASLLKQGAHVVLRLGGRKLDPKNLEALVSSSLTAGLDQAVHLRQSVSSQIVRGQARAFRPGLSGDRREYDLHFQLVS
jgi:SAM-dependent methyltransferase